MILQEFISIERMTRDDLVVTDSLQLHKVQISIVGKSMQAKAN